VKTLADQSRDTQMFKAKKHTLSRVTAAGDVSAPLQYEINMLIFQYLLLNINLRSSTSLYGVSGTNGKASENFHMRRMVGILQTALKAGK
jgi:hypothetical protein